VARPIGEDLSDVLRLGGIGVVRHRFRLSGHFSPPFMSPEPSRKRLLRQGKAPLPEEDDDDEPIGVESGNRCVDQPGSIGVDCRGRT
jgi:hypothetical protein